MSTITFYPIGTKVKLGSVEGTITQIKMTGSKYKIGRASGRERG